MLKIVLVHPPLSAGKTKRELRRLSDTDNDQLPTGLYFLGACLWKEGYDVVLLNHALVPWNEHIRIICAHKPDIIGISSLTFNRFQVLSTAEELKRKSADVRIVLGGVHPTFLYELILKNHSCIDYVVVGEGERSFVELVADIAEGGDGRLIKGVATRDKQGSVVMPGRAEAVADLDSLPIPAEYYKYDILSTSRGCPFQCTFCSSAGIWGCRVREFSIDRVVRELKLLRYTHKVSRVAFKDETFTMKKSRVIHLCQEIVNEGLDIRWSCDTRIDCLDEERLYWMRKAGCDYISFGVETGSERLLKQVDKRTELEMVPTAVKMARKYGILTRFYLIVGLPGEVNEDIQQTLELIQVSKPNFLCVCSLSLSPGTALFEKEYCQTHHVDDRIWEDCKEPVLFNDPKAQWLQTSAGARLAEIVNTGPNARSKAALFPFSEQELLDVIDRVPEGHAPYFSLGDWYLDAGWFEEALRAFEKALEHSPKMSEYRLKAGEAAANAGYVGKAVEFFEQVASMKNVSDENRAVALRCSAQMKLQTGFEDAGLELLRSSIQVDPANAESLSLLSNELRKRGFLKEAAKVAECWITHHPDDPKAWFNRALATGEGDPAGAKQAFEEAIQLNPECADFYYRYGVFLAAQGEFQEACGILEKCRKLDPKKAGISELIVKVDRVRKR